MCPTDWHVYEWLFKYYQENGDLIQLALKGPETCKMTAPANIQYYANNGELQPAALNIDATLLNFREWLTVF